MPKAYLFGTCLIDMFYPEAGLDAIALLKLCDYDAVYPLEQTCCGQPPYNSGFDDSATVIAQRTVELFSQQNYPLIVPSASCAGMIKHHYPRLLKNKPALAKRASDLAKRTYELVDFIADKLPFERCKEQGHHVVALHQSCAAQREMNVAQSWYSVLEKLPGVQVCLPEHHTECCGFGGTFAIKSEAISSVMTDDKAKALLALSADTISTGDCGCLMNIAGRIEHLGHTADCKPLARFIAERFGVQHEP